MQTTQPNRESWQEAGSIAFVAVFVLYATGLVIWLSLGLLPTLASEIPALRDQLTQTATSGGWAAGFSERILDGAGSIGDVKTAIVQYLFSLLNATLGVILVIRRPHDTVPRLLAFALLGTAATFNEPSHDVFHVVGGLPLETAVHFMFHVVSGVAYLWAVVLFPNGRLPAGDRSDGDRSELSEIANDRRRADGPDPGTHRPVDGRVMAERIGVAAMTLTVLFISWRSSFISHPPFFVVFFGILIPLFGVASQSLRIRHTTDVVEQQQARLFRGSLLPAFALSSVWLVAWMSMKLGGPFSGDASKMSEQIADIFPAVFALVPVMLVVSILRYRLWDIDVLVSRTLLYASLATSVAIVFVLLVSASSALFGESLWSTVIAASIVATAIDPLRTRLESIANRIVFGQAITPAQARRSLAAGLQNLTSDQELRQLTKTAVDATRAVSARIWLAVDDHLLSMSTWPETEGQTVQQRSSSASMQEKTATRAALSLPDDSGVVVEIRHQEQVLGVLQVLLPPGERLTLADERLVNELASHAGLLLHNARLTTDLERYVRRLAEQARHLRRSRERIVATHDDERHRLERNLHDGAQQELVALLVNLKALTATATAPGSSNADYRELVNELDELRAMVQSTSIAVQTLCRGDVPEIVLTHGLQGALNAAAAPLRRSGIEVELVAQPTDEMASEIPNDVEAAVYFCCLEALQNVAKHAHATRVSIRMTTDEHSLLFEVTDNGRGFETDATQLTTSGIANMAERLSLVGGRLTIDAAPEKGTSVRGNVPLAGPDNITDLRTPMSNYLTDVRGASS